MNQNRNCIRHQSRVQPEPTSDTERIRKFLEALGQPTDSPPPPPVAPRTNVPARPLAPVTPPMPMVTYPRKLKQPPPVPKIRLPEPVATPAYQEKEFRLPPQEQSFEVQERDQRPAPLPPALAPEVAYAAAKKSEPKSPRPESDLVQLLRSQSGLRNAIILREVFGPPRRYAALGFHRKRLSDVAARSRTLSELQRVTFSEGLQPLS